MNYVDLVHSIFLSVIKKIWHIRWAKMSEAEDVSNLC